ncbi:hypothetical protein K437DRAFT_165545 [Tilletiaria anomala UBC 951]|uniref:Uncharacterized protein n=1 Tax=Tilletiaria anomala (strain ATCC 24038 / CBS 436.72 / UBC 951) TaxID=1037660 RepID=A0A066VKN9_TILAU|nr:uncharacterized protein K437DRAFT_165545 [Tilletiaria anomala UBC 951]KDN42302.1 hypothetical protein K437DRAFT_165545 [Tilletiaria anomala UBC 951]
MSRVRASGRKERNRFSCYVWRCTDSCYTQFHGLFPSFSHTTLHKRVSRTSLRSRGELTQGSKAWVLLVKRNL